MRKVRHVDLGIDDFIVGITGRSAEEIGAYLVVNLLMYSSGGPVHEDDERIFAIIKNHPNKIKPLLKRLVEAGKLNRSNDGFLSKGRVLRELGLALGRMEKSAENGAAGGRPKKDNPGGMGGTQGRDTPPDRSETGGETRPRREGGIDTENEENQRSKKPKAFSGEKLSQSQSPSPITTTINHQSTAARETTSGWDDACLPASNLPVMSPLEIAQSISEKSGAPKPNGAQSKLVERWIAEGHGAEQIIMMATHILTTTRNVRNPWGLLSKSMSDRLKEPAPKSDTPSPERTREAHKTLVRVFFKHKHWGLDDHRPPGHPKCKVSQDIIDEVKAEMENA